MLNTGLYECDVMHRRGGSVRHRFVHRALALLVDVDRLAETDRSARLLSVDRWNLVSFRRRRHGHRRDDASLRDWAERTLREHGHAAVPERILLFSMPDVLGAGFSPLSLWFCEDDAGNTTAVIAEVHNTFGESHAYVIEAGQHSPPIRAEHDKRFFVSPFIGMACRYGFRIGFDTSSVQVAIRQQEQERHLLTATLVGRHQPLTDRSLLRTLAASRFWPLKVTMLIHWQAFRLWRKGLTIYPHKPHSTQEGL